MQLSLTSPPVSRVPLISFRSSLSAVLTGMTATGTLTAVVFNSENARTSITESLKPIKEALLNDTLLSGISKVSDTLNQWGTAIVATKDDLKAWLHNYLGPDGLKSGTAELYYKLKVWAGIIYNWFATKFLKFIENIPDMVQNWRKLRLSLFKWGTFLGGGSGSALWAMFGTGDNWGKLSALMERDDFGEMMSTFADLVEKNDEAFSKMGQEEMEEIIEQYLNEPEEAQKAAKELLEKQKEMADKAKKEQEADPEKKEEKEPQLEQQEIQEAFSPSKGGKPQSPAEVLGNMIGEALSDLVGIKSSWFSDVDIKQKAKAGMERYLKIIEEDVQVEKNRKKSETAKQQFLDAVNSNKPALLEALAGIAKKAYETFSTTPIEMNKLSEKFIEQFNSNFTNTCNEGDTGCGEVNFDSKSIKALVKKAR